MKDIKKIILAKLKASKKKPVPFKELMKSCKKGNFDLNEFVQAVEGLKARGEIIEGRMGFMLTERVKLRRCRVVKLNKTFGFVRDLDTEEDIFIPGKRLKGAMPGDIVLVQLVPGKGESPEGEVVRIAEENFTRFSGEIVSEFGELRIMPDTISRASLGFVNPRGLELHEGDKCIAEITRRGEKHGDHVCEIISCLGSSLKASVCALSLVAAAGMTPVFPDEVIYEARQLDMRGVRAEDREGRLDLRELPIFTIDGASTKDIDDAVSVERDGDGYVLGVHIADVSHYVKPRSPLDNEAFRRGTSVYYANRVIPMLPKELSNGICSLNPGVDRLAFSCICRLDGKGEILGYDFQKSVIRSRVQGVYSEINELFEGYNSKEACEKYAEVMEQLPVMKELAEILKRKRTARGTPQLSTSESGLIIDGNDVCVGVTRRGGGFAEEMIEDFMLTANECAARFGREHELPFVYRVHTPPSPEKIESLKALIAELGLPVVLGDSVSPRDMAEVLRVSRGTGEELVMNVAVLRSMQKARYEPEPLGHFGLALEDYAHFTSPIRRYPDLSIHRIMSAFLEGATPEECRTRFNKFVYASSDQSSEKEIQAMQIERDAEDRYKAEYMRSHIGEEFEGIITSVTDFGIFVELPDTCEGLIRTEDLGEGYYECDGMTRLKNFSDGTVYRIGQPIRIIVAAADVSSGRVDFAPAQGDLYADL